jgi:iron complex outermembrane receptor protein
MTTLGTRGAAGSLCAPRRAIALIFLLAVSFGAQAQTPPPKVAAADELQEVVVTGSRIARPDLDNLEPTTTIDSKVFDRRGYLDVGQALSEIPGFGVQPSSAAQTQSTTGIGQSLVDLYGLGSQRTLVLVNGRRFVSSNTASLNGAGANSPLGGPGDQVDLNVIPTKLIDRVETISVGGAPIYGADAIAGTVNIILKKDYEGLDVDAQAGATGKGDAWQYRTRVLGGTNFFDGRGNVIAVAEFTKTDGLTGQSRPIYSSDLGFNAPATPGQFQQVLTSPLTVPGVSFGGIPYVDDGVFFEPSAQNGAKVGVTNAAGQVLAFGNGGSLQPYSFPASGNPVFTTGGDGLRLSQVSNLLSPTERVNVDTVGNFKFTDHVSAFWEGWFSDSHATNLVAQPAYTSSLFGAAGTPNGDFIININNPFLAAGDRTLIQNSLNAYAAQVAATPGGSFNFAGWNPNQFYLGRANIDLQSNGANSSQTLARGVAGMKGDLDFFDHHYDWEVAANYGESSNTATQPSLVYQNVVNALNSTTNGAGQIVCAGNPVNAPTTTVSSTCAPLDPFGVGSPSLAARQYITHLAQQTSYNTQRDVTGNFNGDVWKLPGGEWKASIGYENRRESADYTPDSFYLLGLGQNTLTGVEGSYSTNEFSMETAIPIFGGDFTFPAMHRLELNGAARWVDNSIAGVAWTYTEGVEWAPVQDIQFRANKTKSIRAPSITELFLPAATSFQFANDPCDKNFIGQGTAPATRAANCAAAGIPTGFVSNVVNATAQGVSSGNQGLSSETAHSLSYGFVVRPRWVPKLNLSVDYISIRLSNAIESLSLGDILDACYDSSSFPSAPACRQFTRGPTGQITNFTSGYVNAGLLDFGAIQAALDYSFDLPLALGAIETRATFLDTQKLISVVGSASPESFAGELAGVGNNKSKSTIDIVYGNKGFSWDWQTIFIGRANFNNLNTPTTFNVFGVGNWWVFNTTLSYNVTKNFDVSFILNNVFNKQPPFPALAGAQGNFTPAVSEYFEGVIGRSMVLQASWKVF